MKTKFQLTDHQLTEIAVVPPKNSTRLRSADIAISTYRCEICGQSWNTQPESNCLGAKIYFWDRWPQGFYTRNQLATKKLNPGPLVGVIHYDKSADGDGWLRLYRESEATPKLELSPARKAPLDKMHAATEEARTSTRCGPRLGNRVEISQRLCSMCNFELMAERDGAETGRSAYEKQAEEWEKAQGNKK